MDSLLDSIKLDSLESMDELVHLAEHGRSGISKEIVHSAFSESIVPTRQRNIWKWAEQNIVLPRSSGTPYPGPYRTSITPWVRGWFDMIQDPAIHTIALETGAQVGKTTTAMIALAYWMVEDPDPILYAFPSEDLALELSSHRMIPIIEESPVLRAQFANNRYDITAGEYRTKQTTVRFIGLLSPAKTASFPHRYIIVDEPDKILRETIGREGGVLGLIFARARQFWNRKRLIVCTPTTANGYIHKYFLLGDQRYYFVPCPHCSTPQILKWDYVTFDHELSPSEAAKGAWYRCVNSECKHPILEKHRHWMTANGNWKATAKPKRIGYASAHLSSLYSNSDECTIPALVEKFLTVKHNPVELREMVNQDFAELWEDRPKQQIQHEAIRQIRDRMRFKRGVVPTDKRVILALVSDVQKWSLVYQIWAMRLSDMWMIDHGEVTTTDELKEFLKQEYPSLKESHSIGVQVLDTGYRTMEIYDYCLNAQVMTVPIKGDTGYTTSQTAPVRVQKIESYPNGKPMPRGRILQLRHLHPRFFRDQLLDALALVEPMPGETMEVALARLPLRLYFHEEIDNDFFSQITGEVLIEEENKNGEIRSFYKKIRRNDHFDCAHYAMALRYLMRATLVKIDAKEGAASESTKPNRVTTPKEKYETDDGWEDEW